MRVWVFRSVSSKENTSSHNCAVRICNNTHWPFLEDPLINTKNASWSPCRGLLMHIIQQLFSANTYYNFVKFWATMGYPVRSCWCTWTILLVTRNGAADARTVAVAHAYCTSCKLREFDLIYWLQRLPEVVTAAEEGSEHQSIGPLHL